MLRCFQISKNSVQHTLIRYHNLNSFITTKIVFLSDIFSKTWFVRFIDVYFHFCATFSDGFTQVSALECLLYRGKFIGIRAENSRGQNVCALQSGVRCRACPLQTGFTVYRKSPPISRVDPLRRIINNLYGLSEIKYRVAEVRHSFH